MEILRSRFWKECGQVALIAGLLLGACKRDKKSASPAEQPSTETDTESYSAGGGSGGGSFSSGDIPATPAIVITSPSGLGVTTALEPVRFEGSCLSGLDVVVTGDVVSGEILTPASGALYQPCIADRFQFEINKSSAGTFRLQFAQGLLGVVPFSLPVEISWTVATTSGPSVPSSQVLPSPPVITQPTGNTSTSNSSTFTVAGTCDNGMQVVIGGSIGAQDVLAPTAGSNSVNCVAGAFSFTIGKTSDNSYTVSLLQRDSQTQLGSSAVQITWVRDTLAPTAPLVTQPSQSPFYDSSSGVTIGGTCESGAQVFLSGGETMSGACAAGQFSFNSNKSADGTYNYTLSQTDPAGNQSATTTLQWVRSASVMPPPTVQIPAANPIYSRNRSLTISGGCTTNATVTLSGAVTASEVSNPSQSLSSTCTASSYSFTLNKSLDGVYDLQVSQSDPATLAISQPVSLTWNVDNMPPVAPLVITPAGGSITSGDTALAVLVQCERWSTVNWSGTSSGTWSGANTGSGLCSDAGDFATSIAQTGDATYAISFTQTDRAGNQSAATIVNWTKDTTLLPTPVFSSPSVSPIWTTSPTMVISGSCTTGFNVDLSGDVTPSEVTSPSGVLTQVCQSSQFSFSVSKANDGHYLIGVAQSDTKDPPTRGDSASATVDWTVDRQSPASVTLTSPSQNPFTNGGGQITIAGACETDAQVYLEGTSIPSTTCVANSYQMTLSAGTSGNYTFVIKERDHALNTSPGLTFTWLVDTSLPPPPTVTAPSSAAVLTATSALTIAGGCMPGTNVVLGGQLVASEVTVPLGDLTLACGSNGSYSFTVGKTTDGTYAFDVSQERNGYYSSPVSLTWTRDTQAPSTSVSLVSGNPNLSATATVSFTSEAGSTSQCSLDGAAYQTCSSPFSYLSVPSGARTVYVRSTDLAGNVGSPGSVTWTQASYNTVALYNFNSGSPIGLDNSLFLGAEHNDATQSGAATPTFSTTGKFGYGGQFTSSLSQSLVAADNNSQDLLASKMTIDAFVKPASIPAYGTSYVIASKMGSTSGNYGWRLALRRTSLTSTRLALSFTVALAGSPTVLIEKVSSRVSFSTSSYSHVAVTWSAGSVQFFINGSLVGSATIGAAGSERINGTTAALRIGADGMAPESYFNGAIDQLRLSQVVRWTSKFTVPTSPHAVD